MLPGGIVFPGNPLRLCIAHIINIEAQRLRQVVKAIQRNFIAHVSSFRPVTILIAENSMVPVGDTTLAHLDKSHITVHTYPEYHSLISILVWKILASYTFMSTAS